MTRLQVAVLGARGRMGTAVCAAVDAAVDLGVIRARVCDPASLLLSNRHAGVRAAAEHEHRKRWSAEENEPEE